MRLLAAASHDLRQPLQAIGLWVELLREQIYESQTRQVLAKIQVATRGAEDILNALLDISRFDLGSMEVRQMDFQVSQLLDRVAAQLGPASQAKGLSFRVRHSPAIARSDPVLLERILSNFVSNAIRHTDRGGVLVQCRRRGSHLSFEVWDTGCGIPPNCIDEVFKEFVQLGLNGRDHGRGLGLGLSIAKRTADLLGHSILVTSRVSKGSCFRVLVPQGSSSPQSDPLVGNDQASAVIRGSFIVFVEDEPDLRGAMEALLSRWGCHTVVASNAHRAIESLEEHLRIPDLLICDYQLANQQNGMDAIRILRSAMGCQVPALIMSGEHSAFLDEAIAESNIRILRKPVRPELLRQALAELLARANLSDA